ncbi:MAG: hypothetical protein IJU30_02915 [Lachnospiraceae bacterium]|nr:hypothetical protein [Lachnospiraceae bacterium]
MKKDRLRNLIFLALCCDLGLFSKRLIAPAANIITDFLRIPGGIGTSFSLMFLIVAAALVPQFGCAALMGAVQSVLAFALGMTGSMGALSPIGYIVPGIVIDCIFFISRKMKLHNAATMVAANMLSAAAAGFTANLIVFGLRGPVLALYLSVALLSGALCGCLGYTLAKRLKPVLCREMQQHSGNAVNAAGTAGIGSMISTEYVRH